MTKEILEEELLAITENLFPSKVKEEKKKFTVRVCKEDDCGYGMTIDEDDLIYHDDDRPEDPEYPEPPKGWKGFDDE